jgi:hypothetical protein
MGYNAPKRGNMPMMMPRPSFGVRREAQYSQRRRKDGF